MILKLCTYVCGFRPLYVDQDMTFHFIGLRGKVADPVHFWPDLDPANLNFNNRIRILLALA